MLDSDILLTKSGFYGSGYLTTQSIIFNSKSVGSSRIDWDSQEQQLIRIKNTLNESKYNQQLKLGKASSSVSSIEIKHHFHFPNI